VSTSPSQNSPGIAVLYRWRLHRHLEGSFIEAWSGLSKSLKARGSLGSRLHRGSDGLWYSYAQWPSDEARSHAFASGSPDDSALALQMRQAVVEALPEIRLECVVDWMALTAVPDEDPL
jgi:hypothetical protein